MVIRRGDVPDIAWVFALLEMKFLITDQHVTALQICSISGGGCVMLI